MTGTGETVLDLLDALVRIDSVNPGLDASGTGTASTVLTRLAQDFCA